MHVIPRLLAVALAISCQSANENGTSIEDAPPVDLSTWTSERIAFPPGFAPDMPAGREVLLFAPGWSDAGTVGFWSYVLLMEIEEPGIDARRLEEILDLYFTGLIDTVGKNNKPFELPADPAEVVVRHERGNRYTGLLQTYNAFGSGSPLTLHLVVDAESKNAKTTILRIQASPETPGEGAPWSELRQAIDSLAFD